MLAEEYIKKQYDPTHETKRLRIFEDGCECGDLYNFHKQLIHNNMIWKEFPQYGLITHQPTGLSLHMALSIKTTSRHKCYTLEKLKERVRNTGTWILAHTHPKEPV